MPARHDRCGHLQPVQPERAQLLGVFVEAVAAAGAAAPAEVPAGPNFFRFSDEAEFAALLRDQGLSQVQVETIAFTHTVPSADDLWNAMLGATVRTSALIVSQPPRVRRRIRTAFDQIVESYRGADGSLDIPVSVRLASGIKP
jgi:hypothetical protein